MPKMRMQLTSNIKGKTKIGYLVSAYRSGRFIYTKPGEVPIGVITESVERGELCEIQTTGVAQVYVYKSVNADETVRFVEAGEGYPAGTAVPIGTATSYTAIGRTVESGKGLIRVALNLGTTSSSGSGGGIPAGGTTGQSLVKASSVDYDTTWGPVPIGDAISDGTTYGRRDGAWRQLYWQVYMGGVDVPGNEIYDGAFVDFVGDTTYIQVQWNQTLQRIELSYVGPTTFYAGWDPLWDGSAVGTTRVGSEHKVDFKSGTYTTVGYNFVSGSQTHEITYDIDQVALDSHYYTQTAADAEFYSRTYINSNFDNYVSWGIVDGIFTRDVISGDSIEFAAGTDMQVQYDGYAGGVHTLTFTYVGTPAYTNWQLETEGVSRGAVGNSQVVDFKGGTYLTVSYFLNVADHEVTIDVDQVALDGRYYTQTAANALFYSQTYINSNFDNYDHWDFEYDPVTPQVKAINSGDSFGIVGGTDIGTSWDGVNNRLTINYAGSVGYTGWTLETGGTSRGTVGNAQVVDFKSGTYTTVSYVLNVSDHEVTIDVDQVALDGRYYTQTAANALFYSQTYINSNFDNYSSWGFEYDTVTPQEKAINSGDSVGIVGGTDIGTSWDGVNNRLTINYTGAGASYLGWDPLADAGSGFTRVGSAHDVKFAGGSNITTTYGFVAGSPAVHTITFDLGSTISLASVTTTTSLITNTIAEHIAGSGVTVDGVLLKDNLVRVTSSLYSSTSSLFMGTTGAGVVYIRPSGYTSATNQLSVSVSQTTVRNSFAVENYPAIISGTIASPGEVRITNPGGAWVANDVLGKYVFYSSDASGIGAREVAAIRGVCTVGGASGGFGLAFYTSVINTVATEKMRLTDAGNLTVTGGVYAAGEIESYDTSDIHLKRIIERMDPEKTIAGLMSLRTVRYEHKHKEGIRLGFIAQDVDNPFPENIKEDADGHLMVHYGKMTVPLVVGFKNHEQRILALEEELSELKESHGSRIK